MKVREKPMYRILNSITVIHKSQVNGIPVRVITCNVAVCDLFFFFYSFKSRQFWVSNLRLYRSYKIAWYIFSCHFMTSVSVYLRKLSTVILPSCSRKLNTMYNLIGFLSWQLSIIPLLCIFDVYQQNMLTIDQKDKEIKWDKLNTI